MPGFESQEVSRWENGEIRTVKDDIVIETSLELAINGQEVITMLCSPDNRRNLAVGFLKSEGIIKDLNQIKKVNLDETKTQVDVSITPDSVDSASYLNRKRGLTSSGGRVNFVNNIAVGYELDDVKMDFSRIANLSKLMKDMQNRAKLFRRTGGSHTAALANQEDLLFLAEDIGRHNAMDKVIGNSIMDEVALNNKALFTSGRLSSEMVLKTIRRYEAQFQSSCHVPLPLLSELAWQMQPTSRWSALLEGRG